MSKKTFFIFWNKFVYGGHLLSLGASGITYTVTSFLNLKNSWILLAISYFLSQIVYSFDHTKDATNDAKKRRTSKTALSIYFLFLISAGILSKSLFLFLISVAIVSFGFFYTLFLKGLTKK